MNKYTNSTSVHVYFKEVCLMLPDFLRTSVVNWPMLQTAESQ